MISKKILLPALAVSAIIGASYFGINQVQAQASDNPFSGLVQKISQKFNLDQTQVQTVFDDYRNEQKQNRQQNMQQREQDRLTQLVKDGKITEDQKNAIIAELASLREKYKPENFKDMTADQRKQQFQNQQDEIKAWAQGQNIDLSLLKPGFGMGGRKGMGMFHW